MSNSILSTYWVERYRPSLLSNDLILDKDMRATFTKYINNPESLHHLLLVGEPGTGKTTLAKALINQIIKDDIDLLHLNGSVDNGVDIVRDRVMAFLKTPPRSSVIKIVFIDEADYLSNNFFAALRATIEQPSFNAQLKTRFIFTANYINKIPDPIVSRCSKFTLNGIPKEDVRERCIYILNNENITYNDDTLDKIINDNYPDMRSIVKTLQSSSVDGILTYNAVGNMDEATKIKNQVVSAFTTWDYNGIKEAIEIIRNAAIENINCIDLVNNIASELERDPMSFAIIMKTLTTLQTAIKPRYCVIEMIYELLRNRFANYTRS